MATIKRHMHTHTYILILLILLENYLFWTIRGFSLYVLVHWNRNYTRTHLLRGQAPPKWQVLEEAPGVHHRRRPLDQTKMTQNKCNKYKELNETSETAKKCQERQNPVILHPNKCGKLWLFARNSLYVSCINLNYYYLLQKAWNYLKNTWILTNFPQKLEFSTCHTAWLLLD